MPKSGSPVLPQVGPHLVGTDLTRLKRVGQGLGLICVALVLEACAPLSFILLLFESGWPAKLFGVVFGTLMSVALLALAVGVSLCLFAPSQARASRFAMATIVLAVACFVAIGTTGPSPRSWWAERLIGACFFATAACFLWYLRRLAIFIGERSHARRAVYILVALIIWYGYGFVGPFPRKLDGPSLLIILDAMRGLVILVAGLSYISLIANLRQSVRRLTASDIT